ncbi:hypothetical protein RUM44_009522 [Polyplax serrata]|uniref:FLYWCH-type domain-containing protein n=1 Tax=Polyplax serrata TaxID=468196 RepID=A0ABR1ASX6_POLSC
MFFLHSLADYLTPRVIRAEEYTIGCTRAGGPQIHHDGYLYNVHSHQGKTRFACSTRSSTKCKVIFSMQDDGSFLIQRAHNHPPRTGYTSLFEDENVKKRPKTFNLNIKM